MEGEVATFETKLKTELILDRQAEKSEVDE